MNFDNYGTMLVMVDGIVERRPISHVQPSPVGHGMVQYEPLLRSGEMVMHTIGGTTHIIKTGL